MHGHLPRIAGLGLGPLTGDDVDPVALEVDILDPQPLEFPRTHARAGQQGVLRQPGLLGLGQQLLHLRQRRPAARLQLRPLELGLGQGVFANVLPLLGPFEERLEHHDFVVHRLLAQSWLAEGPVLVHQCQRHVRKPKDALALGELAEGRKKPLYLVIVFGRRFSVVTCST